MTYGLTIGSKGPQLNPQALVDMKALGFTEIRFQVPWSLVEPVKGNYGWGLWDDAVQKCKSAGIAIGLTMKEAPGFWIGSNGLPLPQGTVLLAQAIVSRYKGELSFLENGNEDYDNRAAADPGPLAASMVAVYPAVKSIQADLPVVMGSILQRNTAHIGSFMDGLWSGARGAFDIANFHFYTGIPGNGNTDPSVGTVPNVPSLPQYIDAVRQSHVRAGHPNFETWCTEFGFATTTSFGRDPRTVFDEATQWKYLSYCYDQLRTSGFITKGFLFTLGYASPSPDGMSLVQANGHQTIAYKGVQSYTAQYPSWGGTPVPPPPPPPPPPTPTPQGQVITLTNFTGTITVTPSPAATTGV